MIDEENKINRYAQHNNAVKKSISEKMWVIDV